MLLLSNKFQQKALNGFKTIQVLLLQVIVLKTMEDGVVDTIVIESRQHKMGRMTDFPPLLASSVFDL